MRHLAVLVFVFAVVGCKSSDKPADKAAPVAPPVVAPVTPTKGPVVAAAGFDRSCTAATDCVTVKPAGCDPCGCHTEAIASKDMARFDEAAAKLACDAPDLKVKCEPCPTRIAACDHGTCVSVPSP